MKTKTKNYIEKKNIRISIRRQKEDNRLVMKQNGLKKKYIYTQRTENTLENERKKKREKKHE